MHVTTVHYQITNKRGELKGHGFKDFKDNNYSGLSNKIYGFKKKYNEKHKNYKMIFVGSHTFKVPKNTRLSSKHFNVK